MKVVSLFSGAGGLDLGFVMAGHQIIWANDLYEDAVETYRHNIGDHIVCEDIARIDASEIPDCDIVIGGFPCQGFSVANTKRHEDDERNELYKQLIRIIIEKRPKFFLAENVKGITNLAKGKVFEMILNDFQSLGYKVKHKILNAADYGVPQTRLRVIIIGVREDVDFEYEYEQAVQEYNHNAHNAERFITLIDKYANFEELTNQMLLELIDKILVHERDVKGSINCSQEIEIYFNFIGKYLPPDFVKEPTAEELEAMEIERKRKAKAHAAYLRRKESGWQKAYEARIKAEKKAKIEAMKEEIRQEDRSNGVYLVVADSPEGQPTIVKKGEVYDGRRDVLPAAI